MSASASSPISSPPSAFEVRLATIDDVTPLVPFCRQSFTDTFGYLYPPKDLEDYLSETYTRDNYEGFIRGDNNNRLWVAYKGDELIGYILVGLCDLPHADVKPGDWEVRRLYISKDHFGTGVSARLMQMGMDFIDNILSGAEEDAPKRGVWLGVWSENYRAQKFYSRYGFEKVGEYEYAVGNCRDREFILKRREV